MLHHQRPGPACEVRPYDLGRCEVDHGGARHVFCVATPNPDRPPREQHAATLAAVGEGLDLGAAATVRLTAFLAGPEALGDFREALRSVAANWPSPPVVVDVVWQPPATGAVVAIEGWGVVGASDLAWVHASVGSTFVAACENHGPLHGRAVERLLDLRDRLISCDVRLSQVVRTWLYLGGIVGPDPEDGERYRALNRARSDVFRAIRFDAAGGDGGPGAYPASTGIGCRGDGLVCGAVAVVPGRDDVRIVALENPRQTPTLGYEDRYGAVRPMFSRGVVVATGDDALIFISGTASILGSATRHVGDAAAQAVEAIANIDALIAESNVARHGLVGFGGGLDDVASARVYVKRAEDFADVRDVCLGRFGAAPMVFTLADVCRPDLLVEIEAVARTTRGG